MSNKLYKAMNKANHDLSDMYIYHLDENEPKYDPELFKSIKFIQSKEVIAKINKEHTRLFVKGKNDLSKLNFNFLTNSVSSSYNRLNASYMGSEFDQGMEDIDEITPKDILKYFGLYRNLITDMFIEPLNTLEVRI